MGTRNLTVVVSNQEVKIAQYGQWDGYPEGQGITILSFLQELCRIEELKGILPKIRFQNEDDIKEQNDFLKSIGSESGWLNKEQAEKLKERYPLQHRDVGGEILEKILEFDYLPEIVLVNAYSFASDSLWCEWAYVIDLDKETFEVYEGLNQSGITPEDRFYSLYKEENEFYPVKIIQSFSLDELPDDEEFLNFFK